MSHAPMPPRAQIALRLDAGLLARIDNAAIAGYRSRNAEIMRRLETADSQATGVPGLTELQLHPEVQRALMVAAERNNVSLHAEILRRLQASVDRERGA